MDEGNYNNDLESAIDIIVRSLKEFESSGINIDQHAAQLCITLSSELKSLVSEIKSIDCIKREADDLMLQLKLSQDSAYIPDDSSNLSNRRQQVEDCIKLYEELNLESEIKVRLHLLPR